MKAHLQAAWTFLATDPRVPEWSLRASWLVVGLVGGKAASAYLPAWVDHAGRALVLVAATALLAGAIAQERDPGGV